jgi:hypothetical protein
MCNWSVTDALTFKCHEAYTGRNRQQQQPAAPASILQGTSIIQLLCKLFEKSTVATLESAARFAAARLVSSKF